MKDRTATAILLATLCVLPGCIGSEKEGGEVTSEEPYFNGLPFPIGHAEENFMLFDQHGNIKSLTDYRGKIVIITFTYTSCPDICLMTEANLFTVQNLLGDMKDKVAIISISIDPARDTVEHLANWTEDMGYTWPHLTHTNHALISDVWAQFGIVVESGHLDEKLVEHHQVSVIYPDNTTKSMQRGIQNASTAINLTRQVFEEQNMSFNEGENGSVSSINGSQNTTWDLYMWHDMGTFSHWMKSSKNPDEFIISEDANHIAWVAEGSNTSLLKNPEMNSSSAENYDYDIGHSTLAFILDQEGRKRVAWTTIYTSDFDQEAFIEDLRVLSNEVN